MKKKGKESKIFWKNIYKNYVEGIGENCYVPHPRSKELLKVAAAELAKINKGNPSFIKISVLGGGGVGKSSLVIMYIQNIFLLEYDPTIEDLYRKQVTEDNITFLLDILDTAGPEEYSAMRDQHIRDSVCIIVQYSIDSRTSFDEVDLYCERIYRIRDVDQFPMVIVGNKIDLTTNRVISFEEGKQKAIRHNAAFFETSAKTGHNVAEVFRECIYSYARSLTPKTLSSPQDSGCPCM